MIVSRLLSLLACFLFALLHTGCAQKEQVIRVDPRGEFAGIETQKSARVMEEIRRGDAAAIALVEDSPGEYQPPVFYELAAQLHRKGRRQEAMYWFYLGQLRARSDANKALDPSASAGVDLMNETFGHPINAFAFQDIALLKKTVEMVVADDAKLPRDYDPRWIALHGMDAFLESKVRFAPQKEWAAIDKKTRDQYLREFREVVADFE